MDDCRFGFVQEYIYTKMQRERRFFTTMDFVDKRIKQQQPETEKRNDERSFTIITTATATTTHQPNKWVRICIRDCLLLLAYIKHTVRQKVNGFFDFIHIL